MRSNFGRIALVWLVCFLIVFVMVLPLTSLFPGDVNYAESFSKDEKYVSVESYLKLEYDGADSFGTVHTEMTVTSQNNVPVDFFLMKKADADPYTLNNTDFDFSRAIVNATNATAFKNTGTGLDPSKYTLLIINSNPDAASIHYLRIQRTNDDLTLVVMVFFLAYMGIVAAWFVAARKLGTGPAPVPLPRGPEPSPEPTGARYRPGAPEPGYRPGAPERPAGAMPASRPAPAAAPEPGAVRIPITCPGCGTGFTVMKGAGPLRIRCPSCGKEGTLGAGLPAAPPPAPMPAPAPAPAPAPTLPGPAAPAIAPAPPPVAPLPPAVVTTPPAPPAPVPKRNISCPRCKTVFPIDAIEGPQHIKCPSCGKEGTIGKKAGAPAAPAPAPAPAPEAPPVPAPTPQLPPAIITGPAPAPAAPAVRPPGTTPAVPPGGRMIGCPQCKKPFLVADPTRPIKVKCPSCGKEGMLKK